MTRLLPLASFLAFAWTLSGYADERPSDRPSEARWAQVDLVTDGDTIVLMDRTRVRLYGIDAPKRDHPHSQIVTATLESMVARNVYLVEVDEDRYGRLVGRLYPSKGGYDINASSVCAGYARWYERYALDSQVIEECQVEAQRATKGVLGDEELVPPWAWRRR